MSLKTTITPNNNTMFTLIDSFNRYTISRHRTLEAAVRAKRKHLAAVKRANGANSYLTYEITKDGEPVDLDDILDAEYSLFCC